MGNSNNSYNQNMARTLTSINISSFDPENLAKKSELKLISQSKWQFDSKKVVVKKDSIEIDGIGIWKIIQMKNNIEEYKRSYPFMNFVIFDISTENCTVSVEWSKDKYPDPIYICIGQKSEMSQTGEILLLDPIEIKL